MLLTPSLCRVASLVSALAIISLSGCANMPLASERTPMSSMFHPTSSDRPMTVNVAGPVEIDVESFNGDVFITADARNPEATVQVIRRAVHGSGRGREAKNSLEQIDYVVDVVAGELGQKLQVRTSTTHAEPHFQRADVHIAVPEVDGVYVRTRNGRVFAQGVQGSIDIITNNGDVRVLTNQRMNRAVTIINNGGNIDYRVRGESSGFFDAQTIGGTVTHRIRNGRCVVQPGTTRDRLRAQFNGGENPITLRTINGNIRIASVDDAERVGRFIFD